MVNRGNKVIVIGRRYLCLQTFLLLVTPSFSHESFLYKIAAPPPLYVWLGPFEALDIRLG